MLFVSENGLHKPKNDPKSLPGQRLEIPTGASIFPLFSQEKALKKNIASPRRLCYSSTAFLGKIWAA